MALPPSGQICFSQLRSEFGYSGQVCMSTFYNNRYTCRDPRNYCMSSWRGYQHSACCPAYGTYQTSFCSGYTLYYRYHDGNCGTYDVVQEYNSPTCGYVAPTAVTINYYTPFNVGCYNYLTFAAASSTAVNTNVDVTINWYGDLGGYMSGTVTIYSGTSCNTASFYSGGGVSCMGENETSNSAYVSPSSSGSQTYSIGSQYNIGYAPC